MDARAGARLATPPNRMSPDVSVQRRSPCPRRMTPCRGLDGASFPAENMHRSWPWVRIDATSAAHRGAKNSGSRETGRAGGKGLSLTLIRGDWHQPSEYDGVKYDKWGLASLGAMQAIAQCAFHAVVAVSHAAEKDLRESHTDRRQCGIAKRKRRSSAPTGCRGRLGSPMDDYAITKFEPQAIIDVARCRRRVLRARRHSAQYSAAMMASSRGCAMRGKEWGARLALRSRDYSATSHSQGGRAHTTHGEAGAIAGATFSRFVATSWGFGVAS